MPYVPFYQYLPAIARTETRVITLLSSNNEFELPAGEYAFVEMFCDECDCRRVFFTVMSKRSKEPVAVISWGWESKQFYIKWFGSYDEVAINEMMGSSLNTFSEQSPIAPKVLHMFNTLLLNDKTYISGIKKHYDLFRNELERKRN